MFVRVLAVVRKLVPWLLLVAAIGVVTWMRVLRPVPVRTTRVERGTVVEQAFGRGTIESQREAALGFDLVGRLGGVTVDEGARVMLGQELAKLDTDQVQADLKSAQLGVDAARASLQRLASDEQRAREVLKAAEREARRTQELFDSGAIPGQERDTAADAARLARVDLDRVIAQRTEATRGIDVAAAGSEQRRVTVVRATLLAPFEGIVTRRLREPGDTVSIGTTVLRVADTNSVYVNASIDETVLHRLALERRAIITFPGAAEPLEGTVTKIGWEVDPTTHELFVEVTPVRVDRRIAIGQRADVSIELARRENVLVVPTRLVQRDATGAFVYVNRGGKIAIARPTFGVSGKDAVEVLDGLEEGDLVLEAESAGVTLAIGRKWRAL
ncbi:MAG: efflux RND transporter periplasmic adaptor subunit [Polyangiaceae bacterium]